MNLLVALLVFVALTTRKFSGMKAVVLALILGFNVLWGAGYFIFSAVTDSGDLAFVLRGLAAKPLWAWRLLMGVLGLVTYAASLGFLARHLPRGSSLVRAYLAAGTFACISVTLFAGPLLPALREAAQESFLASSGLVYLALVRRTRDSNAEAATLGVPSKLFATAVILASIVFLATLGRGYSGA